jgi:hypothetical protein
MMADGAAAGIVAEDADTRADDADIIAEGKDRVASS